MDLPRQEEERKRSMNSGCLSCCGGGKRRSEKGDCMYLSFLTMGFEFWRGKGC